VKIQAIGLDDICVLGVIGQHDRGGGAIGLATDALTLDGRPRHILHSTRGIRKHGPRRECEAQRLRDLALDYELDRITRRAPKPVT